MSRVLCTNLCSIFTRYKPITLLSLLRVLMTSGGTLNCSDTAPAQIHLQLVFVHLIDLCLTAQLHFHCSMLVFYHSCSSGPQRMSMHNGEMGSLLSMIASLRKSKARWQQKNNQHMKALGSSETHSYSNHSAEKRNTNRAEASSCESHAEPVGCGFFSSQIASNCVPLRTMYHCLQQRTGGIARANAGQ